LHLLYSKPGLASRIGLGLLTLVFFFAGPTVARLAAQVKTEPPIPLPVPFTPIVDNANVIDPVTEEHLQTLFYNLQSKANIEFAVVTVSTTGEQDIFDYSLALARGWGIGSKDGDRASFILVVAIQDRKYFTQVSRHLEGDLPDGLVGQIQRQKLVPAFRQGQYNRGIRDTVETYIATLAARRGINIEGIDQQPQTITTDERVDRKKNTINICFMTIVVIVVLLLLFSGGRRGSGCLRTLLLGQLANNLTSGWGGSSGWSGGGFGGSGGGFGGGGGGGFGGGGDFGGGGAGGSW
jgi:uncharacterized protein